MQHSTFSDTICQSWSGGNTIVSVCLLSVLGGDVVTAGMIFISMPKTSHQPQGQGKMAFPWEEA